MSRKHELTEEQIRTAIGNGEFGDDVIRSARNVAVVMSQSWCPQWMAVSRWIDAVPDEADVEIFVVVYDGKKYFNEFMTFKETVFGNSDVPYIRYYVDGKLIKETNYTSKDFFLKTFNAYHA